MAPHAFWIIVDGETPLSFRSRERDDLVPTLTQLKRTQPNVALLWFERGRLWPSPTEAREALIQRRQSPPPGRGRGWRPGGNHVDPRAKYAISRDDKRARFKARATRDRQDEERGPGFDGPPRAPRPPRPDGAPFSRERDDRRERSGPPFRPGGPGGGDRPAYRGRPRPPFNRDRPAGDRPTGDRPPRDSRGGSDRPRVDRPRDDRPRDDRAGRDRRRDDKPAERRKPFAAKPGGQAPGDEPKFGDRPWKPRKPWAAKSPWRPKKPRGPKN